MGDGDGWIVCSSGHRHWGRFGAAGLLLADGAGRVVLQHRAVGTHEGDTWGLPGGARDSHEDAVTGAVREAGEEAGIAATQVRPFGWTTAHHDPWSYTTVVARPIGRVEPYAANWESSQVRWCAVAEIDDLRLHPGFAASWPRLRRLPLPMHVIVDAANVVGSRPDGWWRDRVAATRRLRAGVLNVARRGVTADQLPSGVAAGDLDGLFPHLVVVVEGRARGTEAAVTDNPADNPADSAANPADDAADDDDDDDDAAHRAGDGTGDGQHGWWSSAVWTVDAAGDGDDEILAQALTSTANQCATVVVTADRALRARLPPAAVAVGPTWLLAQIDQAAAAPTAASDVAR